MYEEVEINTPLELARYLVNEGDLYIGEDKARIGVDKKCTKGSPFTRFHSGGTIGAMMRHTWDVIDKTFYKKLNWYDCIPEGKKVPCYVSNADRNPDNTNDSGYVALHDDCGNYPYRLDNGEWVKYATPIPADDLWIPE